MTNGIVPEIYMFSTGGTIAMTPRSSETVVSPALTGEDLVKAIPGLGLEVDLHVYSPYNIPSPHLELEHLMELARKVKRIAVEKPVSGFIVTMGTDTMEEAAYFFDAALGCPNPVVFTGAMKNPALPGADGARNIIDAVTAASSSACRGLGVLVLMNGQIHAARDVTKTHTTDVSTFKSPHLGPLGVVHENQVILRRKPVKRETIETDGFAPRVALVKSVLGGGEGMISLLLEDGIDGLVVEAFGGGHVMPRIRDEIAKVVSRGVPVVVTTRCHGGDLLANTYDYAGSEVDLRKIGVMFGGGLTGPKARIRLSLALGADSSATRLREFFPD